MEKAHVLGAEGSELHSQYSLYADYMTAVASAFTQSQIISEIDSHATVCGFLCHQLN